MQLAVFDVDGTLTDTTKVDAVCFLRTFAEELGITLHSDWIDYTSPTDSGITLQAFQERFGRSPSADEVAALRRRFVGLLEQSFRDAPDGCRAVPGAPALLDRLRATPGWEVAIATGCWKASALLKLRNAAVNVDDVPAAFADDAATRDDILTLAVARSRERYGHDFERVVYVGDGVWDVRTAMRLNVPFVGVGRDEHAARLRREGATHVVPDLTDPDRMLETLAATGVPTPATSAVPSLVKREINAT